MSLATRCTACGTIFRVVQDQLRVSEGWVRCGRCAEVFDAREQLFDIDREAPPPWPAVSVAQAGDATQVEDERPAPPPPPMPSPVWTSAPTPVSPPLSAPPPPAYAREPEPAPAIEVAPAAPAAPVFEADQAAGFVDSQQHSRLEPQWVDEPFSATPPPQSNPAPEPQAAPEPAIQDFGTDAILAPGLGEAAAPPPSMPSKPAKAGKAAKAASPAAKEAGGGMPMPEFMRRAQLSERWRQPRVRAALGVCAGLLAALFAWQFVLKFHDAIASVYPPSQGAMLAFCELSGCELKPWQRIDVIGVEASALNQAGPNNQYQLTVNLRNKSGLEVATPWVELSLTDVAGAVLARRMLAPTEFKGSKTAMPPGAELPLQVLLSTGDQRVSGYSIEIFHP